MMRDCLEFTNRIGIPLDGFVCSLSEIDLEEMLMKTWILCPLPLLLFLNHLLLLSIFLPFRLSGHKFPNFVDKQNTLHQAYHSQNGKHWFGQDP